MKAGASKRDVTVPELLGNPKVHDPLFARVSIAFLKGKELWIICDWYWLEQRLMHREMTQR